MPAFTLIALMPCSGLQAKLACVQAGARHAAQACRLSPHNRTLYPVQLRFLAACRTFSVGCVVWLKRMDARRDVQPMALPLASVAAQTPSRRAIRRTKGGFGALPGQKVLVLLKDVPNRHSLPRSTEVSRIKVLKSQRNHRVICDGKRSTEVSSH